MHYYEKAERGELHILAELLSEPEISVQLLYLSSWPLLKPLCKKGMFLNVLGH